MKTSYSFSELMRIRQIERAKYLPTTLYLFAVRNGRSGKVDNAMVSAEPSPKVVGAGDTHIPLAKAIGKDYDQALTRLRAWVDKDPVLYWVKTTEGYRSAIEPGKVQLAR